MIKQCENCWESYDTERKGAGEWFCPKCLGIEMGVENEMG
ncbi:hypothetical protein LCGC14_0861110 [marine sediment metagenome]|uniref:Uncharacterized protein n=1 Tax=marine sediment metagenome TaxID=412755 RepID=A0A0F9RS29_9ZZZZ